jgi:hypothetical protein
MAKPMASGMATIATISPAVKSRMIAYGSENAKRSAGGFHSTVLVVVFRWSVAGGSLPGVGLSYFVFVSSGLERTGRLRRFASRRR